ncbi:hydroxymethylbilane synthase [Streptoalloteichus hindustanus]|uniref:hydroxymethylbilane synthase n=1 Tax=Streptoalloteichus hindustanus TaxID=2017 RepID=UPI00093655A7|nr:hydroxymethylbilane synthase [Streptoalloteichus hindustanus]
MAGGRTAGGTSRRVLRLGTRESALAVAQSRWVARRLAALGQPVELVLSTTPGDLSTLPVDQLGGTGVFVSALRERLLAGEVDLVVHSCKDLPTAPAPGLLLAAVPEREDPRDVLVRRADGPPDTWPPAGARVGTGSPRRGAQLLAHDPRLRIVPLRGNVDTRLRRLVAGELDAVVLARAGLARLGRLAEPGLAASPLPPSVVLPAAAQGALAVECRADDHSLAAVLGRLDHPASRAAVEAERSLLAALDAGCTAPVAAHAEVDGDALRLTGLVAAGDGGLVLRDTETGPAVEAEAIGRRLARALLAAGARPLITETRAAVDPSAAPTGKAGLA